MENSDSWVVRWQRQRPCNAPTVSPAPLRAPLVEWVGGGPQVDAFRAQ
eukprot:COSAG03_NODE_16236_length_407_cov_1.879870_1_plen_47_part_10